MSSINMTDIIRELRAADAQARYAARHYNERPIHTDFLTLSWDGEVSLRTAYSGDSHTPVDIARRTGRIQWRLPAGFNCQALAAWLEHPETRERLQTILDGWDVDYERNRGVFTPAAAAAIEAVQEELDRLPGPCFEWASPGWWHDLAAHEAPAILAGETTVEDVVAELFGDDEVLEEPAPDPGCVILQAREDLRQALEERLAAIR